MSVITFVKRNSTMHEISQYKKESSIFSFFLSMVLLRRSLQLQGETWEEPASHPFLITQQSSYSALIFIFSLDTISWMSDFIVSSQNITELLRFEKTSKIIKSKCSPLNHTPKCCINMDFEHFFGGNFTVLLASLSQCWTTLFVISNPNLPSAATWSHFFSSWKSKFPWKVATVTLLRSRMWLLMQRVWECVLTHTPSLGKLQSSGKMVAFVAWCLLALVR